LDAIDPRVPDAGIPVPQTDAIDMESKTASARPILRRASSLVGLRTLTFVLLIAATSLYLLERLEPVLRPLLIAILLSYLLALTLARA
jgi:AI-2 transport protein TqsA